MANQFTQEMFNVLQAQAQEEVELIEQAASSSQVPIWFMADGEHVIRPYYDFTCNLFTRAIRIHRIPQVGNFSCTGAETCPICQLLESMKSGWNDAWKYSARDQVMIYCYLKSSTAADDNDFIKNAQGVLSVMIGDWKIKNEFSRFLADGSDFKLLSEMFASENPAPYFKIDYERGRDGICALHVDNSVTDPVPPLPEDHKPITQIYITDDAVPDADTLSKIKSKFYNLSHNNASQAQFGPSMPIDNGSNNSAGSFSIGGFNPNEAIINSPSNNVKKSNSGQKPECFGNHPSVATPQCIVCEFETECQKAGANITDSINDPDLPF